MQRTTVLIHTILAGVAILNFILANKAAAGPTSAPRILNQISFGATLLSAQFAHKTINAPLF